MFTKNYYKALTVSTPFSLGDATGVYERMVNYYGVSPSVYGTYSMSIVAPNVGSTVGVASGVLQKTVFANNQASDGSIAYGAGVVFGNGNTEPSEDDICLSGDVVTGMTVSATRTFTTDDDGVQVTALYTLVNDNENAITIGEVGLVSYYVSQSKSGAQYQRYNSYLAERTRLPNPITIEPGGVGQVTYSIRMPWN